MNLHKFVLPNQTIGPLRIIYSHEQTSIDETRKAENKTDKYNHYIAYDADENNYSQFYRCVYVDADDAKHEAPWHMLDRNPECCSFELVDYSTAA